MIVIDPNDKWSLLLAERDRLRACLETCREYFAGRADADLPAGASSYAPNKEMSLLVQIDDALRRVK